MNDMLKENLTVLRSYRKDLYERVVSYMHAHSQSTCSIEQANNGSFTLLLQPEGQSSAYAYSKYDPEYECKQWSEALYEKDHAESPGDYIMYGIGLTHHLAAYITRFPNHQLYLYEPNMDIFIESLKLISLESLLASPNIRYIAVGESDEEISQLCYWYHTYAMERKELIVIPFYLKYGHEKLAAVLEKMDHYLINYLSLQQYSELIGTLENRNMIRNIPEVLRTPSLTNYKGLWEGKTAIIVGGGPSLERDIPVLQQLSDQHIIISAGTSIQALLKNNIKPHLTVSIDANIYNYNAFSTIDMSDFPFLFIPTIENRILTLKNDYRMHAFFKGNKEYMHVLDFTETSESVFDGTHSVTGTAIQAAIYMGVKEIVFTGQDLSFPNMQLYTAGAAHLGASNISYEQKNITESVINVNGGQNPTSMKMKITLADLEQLISKYQDVTFINCSQGGAVIAGTTYMQLEDVELSGHPYSREDFMADYHRKKKLYDTERVNQAITKLAQQKEWLENVSQTSNKVKQLLGKLTMLSRTNPNKCMNSIAQIEKLWGDIALDSRFSLLIEPSIKTTLYNLDKLIPYIQKEQRIIQKATLLIEALLPVITEMSDQIAHIISDIDYSLHAITTI